MKKVLSALLVLCLIIGAANMGASAADSDFVVENGMLTEYTGSDTDVTIPGGVTIIGESFSSDKIVSVTIPEGVTMINRFAFFCPNMTWVKIPVSVNRIMSDAFACEKLKDIYYSGTREQWNKIFFDFNYGDSLAQRVTIHFTGSGDTPAPSTGFTDVKSTDYYADAVGWAVENDITAGTGGGKFSPGKTCTRDQIVTFLYRAKGSPAVTITNQFSDMPKSEEFKRAISWAVENNITVGDGKGKFLPGKGCTRAEAMTFIWRAAGKPEPNAAASFKDMPSNSDFQKAISWAYENGVTSGIGDGTRFGPSNTCTRGQIVTFLYNAKELM